MNLLGLLRSRFVAALRGLTDEPDELAKLVLPSQDPKFGDYQANCAMTLGRQRRESPRAVAQAIVERLDVADFCQAPQIAGPGFINLRVRDDWLTEKLREALTDPQRLGASQVPAPKTFVLDYSAPNVAKPMHVGHIRSTVIGDCLYRLLRFLGHRTISDNHLGDWGTQFGMIIYGYKHFLDPEVYRARPVAELSRLYRLVNSLVNYHDARSEAELASIEADAQLMGLVSAHADIAQRVQEETAKLHAGDAENRRLWQEFLPHCLQAINTIYQRLGVSFDYTLGESFYHQRLPAVVESLRKCGLATESEGAICVFFEGQTAPMIVQKQDGAYLYATTDLATLQYRVEKFHPDAVLYVVDHRQSLHFEQLFATARRWGYRHLELQHIRFGAVLGQDNRPFKTRSGDTVGLSELLDEAVRRAYEIVCANDDAKETAELSAEDRQNVAEIVGIAALKYADLAQNRESDYVFSYDKMLAMRGNTATYMQYSYARVRSIFAKGKVDAEALRQKPVDIEISHPAERALALALLQFSEALQRAAEDYRPNHLTAYLFELAGRFAEFFEQCPVLRAESDALRLSRLVLCDLTGSTIKLGLSLLGIEVVDRM
jgi:arginyl-tRNA synthetase